MPRPFTVVTSSPVNVGLKATKYRPGATSGPGCCAPAGRAKRTRRHAVQRMACVAGIQRKQGRDICRSPRFAMDEMYVKSGPGPDQFSPKPGTREAPATMLSLARPEEAQTNI